MKPWLKWLTLYLHGIVMLRLAEGTLKCQCNTQDCQMEGKTTCNAEQYCYVEFFKDMFTRGCINDRTPLLCENRKPKNLNAPWPSMYCCKDSNFCNRNVLPTLPIQSVPVDPVTPKAEFEKDGDKTKCPYTEDIPSYRAKSEGAKIINPIYIAVPVAGVCVLLALIIFAMYLLRRRNDNFQGYHYHEHLPALQKQCNGKKPVTTCSSCGRVNRCTDSERSSSGSETKLFLQV
ncbi:uncharacterized protein LOC121381050 [Gigantopelta aegis]|uniref:uncharacterized protein LOC121381050 n=1 Tax=Gigantopelta aegis TaxID=1735272 RepID=UPI001B88BA49|nr:uncharacterized protein LOC121381050 [Gigantopelta aegis]